MLPYAIGLDIGITSVGWAAVALDANERPCGIIDMGVRIFDAAENPKTGASLAAPRREKRSLRRRIRRHRHRNERIRHLLLSSGIVSEAEMATLFDGKLEDVYTLRVRALDAPLTNPEFARVLIHLAQHRGFKSNRINSAGDEDGALLSAVSENKLRMQAGNYRTVGEMLLRDSAFSEHKRNKGGTYLATVSRDMVEDEAHSIFAAQRAFGNGLATEELEKTYLEILLSQRSFDEGPGGNSPYAGEQILGRVGSCTLFPEEKRAAKATYSFEYFNLLERINHIRLVSDAGATPLTAEQRRLIIDLAHKTEALDYAKLRKALSLPDSVSFNMVRYRLDADREAAEKKEKFAYLKSYHQMRKAIDRAGKGRFALLSVDQRDEIATVLTLYKTEDNVFNRLTGAGIEACDIESLNGIGGFSKFGHLSVKACRALTPYLEQGMNYNDACAAAGLEFKGHSGTQKDMYLHPCAEDYEDVTSPVVRRAVAQSIKVLNAIIRKRGCSPTYINIELARELAKSKDERNKIEKEYKENRAKNEKLMDSIREDFGILRPSGQDLVKLRLYREQDGISPYSQKAISLERLFEPGYAEVDHIIPYSISFDDSYKNKVLVFASENRDKGNRLPLQYLTGEAGERFTVWVNASVRDYKKKRQLLRERLTPEDEKSFRERNLQDTKTMSVFLMNYIRDHLLFAPSAFRKKRVYAVNGIMTSYMRKRWGITKVREDGDLHHAVDALTVVCTTDAMIQQISRYAAWRECEYMQTEESSIAANPETGEVLREFPYPWPQFRRELEARTANDPQHFRKTLEALPLYRSGEIKAPEKPIFVSRMPRRKVSGAAHEDTIRSPQILKEEGKVISRRPLTDLRLNKETGKLEDCNHQEYYNPESDRLLYAALRDRLVLFNGDAAKAFAEPFYKPKRDGSQGPRVEKVKLTKKTTLPVSVNHGDGVADNEKMLRIDVFFVEGNGYYFIPIYVADTKKPELPNKACIENKEWKSMRDEDFIFSLYSGDLIRVVCKRGLTLKVISDESTLPKEKSEKETMLYYKGSDINTTRIQCITHDNAYSLRKRINSFDLIEKYSVDVLGEYHPVKKETRQKFTMKRG